MLTRVLWAATSVGVGVGVYLLAEHLERRWQPACLRRHCWAIRGSGVPTPLPDLTDQEENNRFALNLLDQVSKLLISGRSKKGERLLALAVAMSENRAPILRMASTSISPRAYNRLLATILEIDRGWDCLGTRHIVS